MSFHVVAYQANAATATDTTLTPIDDDVLQTINNGFFSNSPLQLIASIGYGADLQRYQIQTPSLNCLGYDWATQIIDSTGGNDQSADFLIRDDRPLMLKAREEIDVLGHQDNVGAQDITVLLLLTKGLQPAPSGSIFTIRGTSTTAAVADTWTTLTMTWGINLPAGNYGCLGGRLESANCFGWRVNAQDCEFRPGYVGMADVGWLDNPKMRFGRLGLWCNFDNNLMPQIQVLCSAATASHVFYMDVIQR